METERQLLDPWKVRWCGPCALWEYDTGVPRGWVTLKGDAPGEGVLLPWQRRELPEAQVYCNTTGVDHDQRGDDNRSAAGSVARTLNIGYPDTDAGGYVQ